MKDFGWLLDVLKDLEDYCESIGEQSAVEKIRDAIEEFSGPSSPTSYSVTEPFHRPYRMH